MLNVLNLDCISAIHQFELQSKIHLAGSVKKRMAFKTSYLHP